MRKGKQIYLDKINIISIKGNILISVFKLNKSGRNAQYNYILCQKCSKFLNINDDKISMTGWVNNHKYFDLSIEDFMEKQNKKELKINCSICINNKIFYNDIFIYAHLGNIYANYI